jgi:hypothetical protein
MKNHKTNNKKNIKNHYYPTYIPSVYRILPTSFFQTNLSSIIAIMYNHSYKNSFKSNTYYQHTINNCRSRKQPVSYPYPTNIAYSACNPQLTHIPPIYRSISHMPAHYDHTPNKSIRVGTYRKHL